MRVVVSPAARMDVDRYAEHIAIDSLDAGLRFLDRAEVTFDRIGEQPSAGRIRNFRAPELSGMRSRPVQGFPNHFVFYQHDADRVVILRVLHGALDLRSRFGHGEET